MDAVDQLAAPPGSVAAGARAMAPVVVGYAPFALLVGAHVATSADPIAAWMGTSTIYGGAAQLAVLDVLAGGGSVVAAALTGLLLQARLAVYAAALAPDWRSASLPSRLLAAFTLTDVPWALSQAHAGTGGDVAARRRFYLGAALTLWVAWPVMVTVGTVCGAVLAHLPVTGLVVPLLFGALVVPHVRERRGAATVLAAAAAALATWQWSAGSALLAATVAGAAVAALGEWGRR